MAPRVKKYLLIILLVISGFLASVIFGLVPINLFFAKNTIREAVHEAFGVELEVQGRLAMKLGFRPQLSASGIVLHSPRSNGAPLLKISHLQIRPILLDLWRGDVHFRVISATSVVINYCPGLLPVFNSDPKESDTTTTMPSIAVNQLSLEQLQLQCDQPEQRLAFLPGMIDVQATARLDQAMTVTVSGRNADEAIDLFAATGSLSSLLSDPADFPVELRLSAFQSSLNIEGSVRNPGDTPTLTAHIEFSSENPSALLSSAGKEVQLSRALPGPMAFKAETIASLDEVRVSRVEGKLGENHFSLSGLLRDFTRRPYLEIDAQLAQLDFEMMSRSSSPQDSDIHWLDVSLQAGFDALQQFDAKAHISIDRLLNAPLPMEGLDLSASLDQGRLVIDQAQLTLAGSLASARAGLNLLSECPELTSELQLSGVDLKVLSRFLDEGVTVGGRVEQAVIETSSCGWTLREQVDSLHLVSNIEQARPVYQGSDWPEAFDFLSFDSLLIDLAQHQTGRLAFQGELFGEPLGTEITFGSLADILAESRWPLRLKVDGAGTRLNLDGSAAYADGVPTFAGQLEADISRFGALHPWIGSASDNPLAAKLSTRLSFDHSGWSISDLNSRLGRSDLRGSLLSEAGKDGPLFSANLNSDLLDMNELAGLFPEPAAEQMTGQSTTGQSTINGTDLIEEWFGFPSIDFELTAGRIEGIRGAVEGVSLKGRIRDRLIEDGRLNLVYDDVAFAGTMNADLRQRPWKLAYHSGVDNIDIGNLLRQFDLAQDVVAHADRWEVDFISEGLSIRQLAANARIESRVKSLTWTGVLHPGEETANELKLSHLEIAAAPSKQVDWSAEGELNGEPVSFLMRSPSIKDTFHTRKDLPLNLVLRSGNAVVMLETVIKRESGDQLLADIAASGQIMDTETFNLSELTSPLGQFEMKTRLSVLQGELHLSDLEARVGSSKLSGQLDIDRQDDRYSFGIYLRAPWLETDDFVNLAEEWRSPHHQTQEDDDKKTMTSESTNGFVTIINDKISDLTETNSFNIDLSVDELYSAGNYLGQAHFTLAADEDGFQIKPMSIVLPGGNVDAEYYGNNLANGVEVGLKIHIEQLEYGGLLRLLDPESTANGLMYLDTSLHSTAPDWNQLAGSVQGNLDLLMIPEDIEAGFLDLWASNLVFALLPTGDNTGKKLNCLVARFETEEGVMKTKNVLLDSTEIIVRGRGSIDLGNRQLDLLFAPQAKQEKFLSVSTPIEVTGPFDDYQIGVTSGGFVMTLFRWYMGLIYVPFKWLTGENFPPDGIATCFHAMEWDSPDIRAD